MKKESKGSETKYRDLFDNANDCIYTIDLDGNFLIANNSAAKAMKCTSVEEVLASNMSNWMTQESFEKVLKFMHEIITEEDYNDKSVVIEIIRKDGKHVWFEHKARPLKDDNSNIIGIHGIGRDITEKIRFEKELRQSEEQYRDLFENAQDAMYVLDKEGIVLKMNHAGLRIMGCTKEEVIGNNISKWLTPESKKIVEELIKKCRSGERVNETEILEIAGNNNVHRWIEIKTREIDNRTSEKEIHCIGRDITENVLLKKELNKSNKQRKLLSYLIKGTRGGKSRTLILKHLIDRPYNAHQLANAMKMNYKTVRHHLDVLIKNGVVTMSVERNCCLYYISNSIAESLFSFDDDGKLR